MIQRVISNAVVSELSQKLHSKVSVGNIDYKLFDDISIHNLYVEDLNKDTLLSVNQADAKFKFWKFFTGKIIFTSIDLNQLYGNLVIDKNGKSNLDFVIYAFKTPQKNDTTQITYRISHFRLKDCRFTYTNFKELQQTPNYIFNGNKLNIKNINADVSLNLLNKDSFNIGVQHLSANEQSGLVLTSFKTQIFGSKKGIRIPEIKLEMPNSNILLENTQLKYDSLGDLQPDNTSPILVCASHCGDNGAFARKLKTVALKRFSSTMPA